MISDDFQKNLKFRGFAATVRALSAIAVSGLAPAPGRNARAESRITSGNVATAATTIVESVKQEIGPHGNDNKPMFSPLSFFFRRQDSFPTRSCRSAAAVSQDGRNIRSLQNAKPRLSAKRCINKSDRKII